MPYLRVDLDGKKKFPMVATGCGIRVQDVSHAMLELWEMVWRSKRDTVNRLQLECLFGAPGEKVAMVLEAFGFVENLPTLDVRVRGAEAYLRISAVRSEAGRKGGKKTAEGGRSLANLKQNTEANASDARSNAEATAEAPPKPLHPITHPPIHPIRKTEALSAPSLTPPPKGLQEAWNLNRPPGLPEWVEMPKSREAKARSRLTAKPDMSYWSSVISRIRDSSFCLGENERGWRASPDWLLQPETAAKVLEGKYDNRRGNGLAKGLNRETTDEDFRRKTAHLKTTADGLFILGDDDA